MTARLIPDVSPERESALLDRFALRRRAYALSEQADCIEANGGDAEHLRAELARTRTALDAINELPNQN